MIYNNKKHSASILTEGPPIGFEMQTAYRVMQSDLNQYVDEHVDKSSWPRARGILLGKRYTRAYDNKVIDSESIKNWQEGIVARIGL